MYGTRCQRPVRRTSRLMNPLNANSCCPLPSSPDSKTAHSSCDTAGSNIALDCAAGVWRSLSRTDVYNPFQSISCFLFSCVSISEMPEEIIMQPCKLELHYPCW